MTMSTGSNCVSGMIGYNCYGNGTVEYDDDGSAVVDVGLNSNLNYL